MQTDVWKDSEVVDQHPYYGDKANYFPTIKQFREITFKNIKVDQKYKANEVMGDEFFFGLNSVEIDDNHLVSNNRANEFVNVVEKLDFTQNRFAYNFEHTTIDPAEVIFLRNFMLSNKSHRYSRVVTSFIDEVSAVGGLFYPVLSIGIVMSIIFVDPFRKMDLALAFNELKNSICVQESVISKDDTVTYTWSELGLQFKIYWWAYHRLPKFIVNCLWAEKQAESNNKIKNQLKEFFNQVQYLLSVKYQTQTSLVSQLSDLQTQALIDFNQNKGFSIVVQEIIKSYAHQHDDHLCYTEMFRLVKEIMPEIDANFDATDDYVH